jgi:hypothetical protein
LMLAMTSTRFAVFTDGSPTEPTEKSNNFNRIYSNLFILVNFATTKEKSKRSTVFYRFNSKLLDS